jgi:putative flippase GtrA
MEAILARTIPPHRQALLMQFLRFGTVGTFGFVVDSTTVYVLKDTVGLYWAGLAGFITAASFNWALNRVWTFRGYGSGRLHRQWLLFLAANLCGFVLNRGTYFILVSVSARCADQPVLAVAAGSLAGMFVNFVLSRTLVFR